MTNPINNTVFDSRDLIAYRDELEAEILDAYTEWAESHNEHLVEDQEELEIPMGFDEIEYIDEEAFTSTCKELIDEYEDIKGFIEELEGYGDFDHGEAIIHEDYWEDYVQEFCEDVGYVPKDMPSWIEIDWDRTAENFKMDYMTITYQGSDYYMRA